jgi:uncharacterized SAM-binding protein YcdF (DUF218 family)
VTDKPYDAITDFIFVEDEVSSSDIIFVAGGSRPQLIERAIELYRRGMSRWILPSGGPNSNIQGYESEWSFFHEIAIKAGVPEEAILKEDKARNTFENARLSRQVADKWGLSIQTATLVCKAHHSRRALMTYQTEFPRVKVSVSPILDERRITRYNWMADRQKIEIVMKEIEKIGQYFGAHIPVWVRDNKQ